MKIEIVDWSDDAYRETKKKTGTASSRIIARLDVSDFKGFSFDGGRFEIPGTDGIVWVPNQFSVNIVDEWTEDEENIDD